MPNDKSCILLKLYYKVTTLRNYLRNSACFLNEIILFNKLMNLLNNNQNKY